MKLQKNDKSWWRLNKELLHRKSKLSSIPSLKNAEGKWLMDSKLKAEEFAIRWMMKNTLPAYFCESYPGPKTNFMNEHIQIFAYIAGAWVPAKRDAGGRKSLPKW